MTAAPPASCDLLVIGGGILGSLVALDCAAAGVDVAVIERGAMFREASGVNAGGFAIQTTAPEITANAVASVDLWAGMADRLGADIGFKRTGGFRVATSPGEAEMLQAQLPRLTGHGLAMSWCDEATVRAELPFLGPRIIAASHCAEEGFAVPMLAGAALREALIASGARVTEYCEVTGITREAGGQLVVTTAGSTVRPRRILVASGAWNGRLAGWLGVTLPLVLKTFMLTVTRRSPAFLPQLVTHAQRNLTIKQFPNGSCVIGGGWPGRGAVAPVRKDIDVLPLAGNLAHAVEVIPELARIGVARVWAGLEGATTDELPLMGPLPGHDDVHLIGCVRGGFVLGPILAPLMSDALLGRGDPGRLAPFAPGRFAASAAGETHVH